MPCNRLSKLLKRGNSDAIIVVLGCGPLVVACDSDSPTEPASVQRPPVSSCLVRGEMMIENCVRARSDGPGLHCEFIMDLANTCADQIYVSTRVAAYWDDDRLAVGNCFNQGFGEYRQDTIRVPPEGERTGSRCVSWLAAANNYRFRVRPCYSTAIGGLGCFEHEVPPAPADESGWLPDWFGSR